MGYEPLPPTLGRNIFGRQVYQLPGLFAYGEFTMYELLCMNQKGLKQDWIAEPVTLFEQSSLVYWVLLAVLQLVKAAIIFI